MKNLLLVLIFFFQAPLLATSKMICLNMIVKNESPVIRRCLDSVKSLIDYWVIVDTGSSDGTQEIIQEVLRDIPGELHQCPWVDFEHNRNEALTLAKTKADYLLMIDADEVLSFSPEFVMPLLDKDCYFITVREAKSDYQRLFLISTHFAWRWEGVLHETLISDEPKTFDLMEGVVNLSRTADGFRSQDPQKYAKDARILEAALEKDPTNSRYVFYLAMSYRNAGEYKLALQNYQKRATMGGWDEEVFWSLYQGALFQEYFRADSATVIDGYTKAYQYRPSRAEPLYRLANYYLQRGDYFLAYITAKHALSIQMPADHVFVERWIYIYGLHLTFANCAFEVKQYGEAAESCRYLLSQPDLPPEIRQTIQNNLKIVTMP